MSRLATLSNWLAQHAPGSSLGPAPRDLLEMIRVGIRHGLDDLEARAERPDRVVLVGRLVVGHHDQAAVAARKADVREADAGVAGRAIDHGAARGERAAALGILDQAARGAILDRAARVHELGLAEDVATGLAAERLEPDQRRIADRVDESLPEVHLPAAARHSPPARPAAPSRTMQPRRRGCPDAGRWRNVAPMKLQQLRYLVAIVDSGLNISAAAEKLHTSQPGVSRQIKLLEDELGFELFLREGRALTRLTQSGTRVVERAQRILREAQAIKGMSLDVRDEQRGTLSIATTHTQARYVLPPVIAKFREKYPKVRLHLHQGTSDQIAEMVNSEHVDLAIATGSREQFPNCVLLPCYEWYRRIVVPKDHPLARARSVSIEKLAGYPIVTYVFSLTGPRRCRLRSSAPASSLTWR